MNTSSSVKNAYIVILGEAKLLPPMEVHGHLRFVHAHYEKDLMGIEIIAIIVLAGADLRLLEIAKSRIRQEIK